MRLPTVHQRIACMGKTGSGKTQFALWLLSLMPFDLMPWCIVDYKRDPLVNAVPGLQEISLENAAPTEPGLYIVHPTPDETELVTEWLWSVWRNGRTGLLVDEGYMVGANNPAFDAIETQGRSKEIPTITLSQRPVWMSRFVFSEADFFAVFRLTDERDRRTVQSFLPESIDRKLPSYWSYWYDVARDEMQVLRPVPEWRNIEENFLAKLPQAEEEQSELPRFNFV